MNDVPAIGRQGVFLIAEIGSNHDGHFDQALRLMDVAQQAGTQAVKFQSFLADHLVKKDNPDYALLKRIELPREWYSRLKDEAAQRGMFFFSTATNPVTLGWMEETGVALYKLASPNITHLPLVRATARLGKPVILSTGMAGFPEIGEAVRVFEEESNPHLSLLHCVSEYPADPAVMNLRFIPTLHAAFGLPTGFSDHTLDIGAAVAAVALGACIIEKHLTLDRALPGPDHHYSLEPGEFLSLARNIRLVEQALGSPTKRVSPGEKAKSALYWRSLHASRDLTPGQPLEAEHVDIVRPNDGLHPRHLENVLGLTLKRPVAAGNPLTWEAFK